MKKLSWVQSHLQLIMNKNFLTNDFFWGDNRKVNSISITFKDSTPPQNSSCWNLRDSPIKSEILKNRLILNSKAWTKVRIYSLLLTIEFKIFIKSEFRWHGPSIYIADDSTCTRPNLQKRIFYSQYVPYNMIKKNCVMSRSSAQNG